MEALSTVRLPPLKACTALLVQAEETYLVPGLHVHFLKRERAAQLNVLFTKEEPRGMVEEKSCYAVEVVTPFAASFTGISLGFEETGDLTKLNAFYRELVSKLLFGHNGGAKTVAELASLVGDFEVQNCC